MALDFEIQLTGFIEGSQKVIDDYFAKNYPSQGRKLVLERGQKNIRVVAKDVFKGEVSDSGSAWAFIDIRTGDILKPASWKAPAKHARGNIMEDGFGVKYIGPYGPSYLR
jgi:hypothetical protein